MKEESKNLSNDELKAIIEEKIQETSKLITKEKPFKMTLGSKNYFLPPIEFMAQFFGLKVTPKSLYDVMKSKDAGLLNISSSSLHEMPRKGVGKSVFKKFFNALISINIPSVIRPFYDFLLGNKTELERAYKVNSNAHQWLAFFNTFDSIIKDPDSDQQQAQLFRYLIHFITQRSYQEVEFFESLKAKQNEFNLDDKIGMWEKEISPFYSQNTQISKEALDWISLLLLDEVKVENLSNEQKSECIYFALELEYDFLINCFACYEVGYVSLWYDPKECKKWLISEVLDKYTNQDNKANCFRCFIDVLVEWLKLHNVSISQNDLASCVPYTPSEKIDKRDITQDDIEISKRNKLYKWYRGVDLPSVQSLESFFINLSELTSSPIDFTLMDVAQMTIGLDKALEVKMELFTREFGSDIDIFGVWKQWLGTYPKYYNYHCNQFNND
ncbi:hypothetical protein [Aliivibrio fischeri]|uniref:hypothetical protein n=1 Tax=Aliivibrio fischeri TaxID=668 RepID=UPI0012D8F8FA|nr:hypothetical protein [Aliivibrio fischeri]MUI53317.1 hypothetical protein [Aliivibrio fischeri]